MTITRNTVIILLLIFNSCNHFAPVNQQDVAIAQKIASVFGARNCSITTTDNVDSKYGVVHFATITIDSLNETASKWSRDRAASVVAWMYYASLDSTRKKLYSAIYSDINVGKEKYEKRFATEEITQAIKLSHLANRFLTQHSDSVYCRGLTDSIDITDTGFEVIQKVMVSNDSVSPITFVTFTGFAADKIKETGEPVTILWAEVQNGNLLSDWRFIFINRNEKIGFIGVNEKDHQ